MFEWTPYVSHGGILRISATSCCGQYEVASEAGQFFVLRQTQDGYEESGRGRAHPKVVEIYAALVIKHQCDEHANRGERPELDDSPQEGDGVANPRDCPPAATIDPLPITTEEEGTPPVIIHDDVQDAAALRDAMTTAVVAKCAKWGFPLPAPVEAAFRTVPRHLFAPEVAPDKAYALDLVVVKRDEHGALISTMSAPEIQAMQLVQADISPGMRVLEIGSGGFFASLLSELIGPAGQVTTMDIDADVTSRARDCLDAAGYRQVRVVTADAEHGWEANAPYDRIMVTVGAWDIPPAWREQLAKGGRIVVPLRMKGITRSLALERTNDHLVSLSQGVCGFVPIQGAGQHDERLWLLNGEQVGLRFDDGNFDDPHKLDGVLASEPAAAWSGVTVTPAEPFPDLPLWMATALPGFCTMTVNTPEGEDPGILSEEGGRWFPYAAVQGDSFAHLSIRPAGEGSDEFGAHGYGPHGSEVAQAIVEQIQVWDRDYRGGPGPQFAVWPIGTPAEVLPKGGVITKQHTHATIYWPDAPFIGR
ncbi:methyltransferase, FxLD system [Nonomuraea sp. NPDC049695]|uniref:methyltransferase, FxLD system n=1 Tax=Nonomuraea sp. NPDC049695 TaxID=3154734 RepID=UPI00341E53C7